MLKDVEPRNIKISPSKISNFLVFKGGTAFYMLY